MLINVFTERGRRELKKTYNSPEFEMRKVYSFEAISASGDEMAQEDNELNVSKLWGTW